MPRRGVPSTTDSARVTTDVCGEPAPLPRSTNSPALLSTRRHFPARVQPLIETPQKGRKEGTWSSARGRKAPRLKGRRDGGGFMSLVVFKARKRYLRPKPTPRLHPTSH